MSYGKVLVVDDDAGIVRMTREVLQMEGYEVVVASDGPAALVANTETKPDVIVLDVMLPYLDGLSVCREIRRTCEVPILFVSSRDTDVDKILGLEVGADDYLAKPFNPRELAARVRTMFRRLRLGAPPERSDLIVQGPLRVNMAAFRADCHGHSLALTPLEFALLKTLAASAGTVLTRQVLLDRVWGPDYVADERTVDVHIKQLRRKLEETSPGYCPIVTVRGVGYRFEG